jgi:hypothetical protein
MIPRSAFQNCLNNDKTTLLFTPAELQGVSVVDLPRDPQDPSKVGGPCGADADAIAPFVVGAIVAPFAFKSPSFIASPACWLRACVRGQHQDCQTEHQVTKSGRLRDEPPHHSFPGCGGLAEV